MRILQVSLDSPQKTGGLSIQMSLLAQGWQALGHTVDCVYPDSTYRPPPFWTRVRRRILIELGLTPHLELFVAGVRNAISIQTELVSKHLSSQAYDVLSVQDCRSAIAARAALQAMLKSIPIIITMHGYFAAESVANGDYSANTKAMIYSHALEIERQGVASADGIVTIDKRKKRYILNQLQYAHNIKVIYNAVDGRRFCPVTEVEKAILRKELDLALDKVLILVPRRLIKYYSDGLLDAFRALERMAGQNAQGIVLYVAGDGPEREKLSRYIQDHQLSDRIKMLGTVNHDIIDQYYKAADIVLLPAASRGIEEGPSLCTVEGLSCGKVVIASTVGSSNELIRHGYNGRLVEPEDPAQIAETVLALVSDPEMYHEMSRNAQISAQNHNDHVRHARRYTDFFEEIGARPS